MKKIAITKFLLLLSVFLYAQEENTLFTYQLKQIIADARNGFPSFRGSVVEEKTATVGYSDKVYASKEKISMSDSAVIAVHAQANKVLTAQFKIYIRLDVIDDEAEQLYQQFNADIARVVGKDFDLKSSKEDTSEESGGDSFTSGELYTPVHSSESLISSIDLFRSSMDGYSLVILTISYDSY